MNTRMVSRCIAGCLSLALMFQLGTAHAYAAYIAYTGDTADEKQSMAVAEQSEWDRLEQELSKNGNPVSRYVNQFDGKEKTIVWVQGIQPPSIGGKDADLQPYTETVNGMTYHTYQTPYIKDHGWYDVNKTGGADTYLCFAVAATNSLHWWMDQNDAHIQQYVAKKDPNDPQRQAIEKYQHSFHSQTSSEIFEYFKGVFGNRPNGYWPDLLEDHFLNGYPYKTDESDVNIPGRDIPNPGPDSGFFYDVLGDQLLTGRHQAGNYDHASDLIKQLLMDGNIVMPTYEVGQNSHVVTLWGAEYDLDGKISAVFLSDSDDGDVTQQNQAMKRFRVVRAKNGRAIITTHADGSGGNPLYLLNSLSLGKSYWQDYSGAPKQQLTVEWGNSNFAYDGNPHKPEVISVSGVDQSHDVQVVSAGEQTDAGTYGATAVIQGADAGKYKIQPEQKMHSFTIRPAEATVTVTADVNEYAKNGTVLLHAEVNGVKGQKPEGTIVFSNENGEIGTGWTIGGAVNYRWKTPASSSQIIAHFTPENNGVAKNYAQSQSAPISVDLAKKNQAPLVFDPINGKRFGDPDFELNATGGSGSGAFVYSSSNPDVITINGSTASIKGAGVVDITATKLSDGEYNSESKTISVRVAKGTAPEVRYPTASDLTYGQPLANSSLSGGSTELGSFAWKNPSAVLNAGSTQQVVTFTPNSVTEQNYEQIMPLSSEVTVTVSQAVPTVTLSAEVKNNDTKPEVILTAEIGKVGQGEVPADGVIKFVDCTGSDCTDLPGADAVEVRNGIAAFSWTGMQEGTYRIKAEFSGNANYTAAASSVETVDTTASPQKTYPVVVKSDGNGTASASHTSASQGMQVTLSAVPNPGFQFKEWKVLEGQITLSGNAFVMPDMPVSLQAIFEKKDDPSHNGDSGSGGSGSNGGNNGGSTSSGSSSTKPDSETTEIVKQPDGTVIQETQKANGSSVVEMTLKDGSTSVTEIDRAGKTDTQVKIPEKVSAEANQLGQPVALPMPPAAVQSGTGDASTVRVDVGNAKNVTVSVPVDKAGPGVVAVEVKPDGTKQVVRKSIVNENGVLLTLDGTTTLEIEDRSKVFEDARGHWASDAIAFVSSREICNGTTATTFSPDTKITRGMLVKILHNLEGNPLRESTSQFADVAPDAWFADSIQWAVDSGIVMGFGNNRFAPEKQITREEVAVILYRYAGSPALNGEYLNFNDADQVSAYADAAVRWAVENGIITGTNTATLNPKGTATRAQTAVMIMRFMNTIMG